jgi:hypothetical protein
MDHLTVASRAHLSLIPKWPINKSWTTLQGRRETTFCSVQRERTFRRPQKIRSMVLARGKNFNRWPIESDTITLATTSKALNLATEFQKTQETCRLYTKRTSILGRMLRGNLLLVYLKIRKEEWVRTLMTATTNMIPSKRLLYRKTRNPIMITRRQFWKPMTSSLRLFLTPSPKELTITCIGGMIGCRTNEPTTTPDL